MGTPSIYGGAGGSLQEVMEEKSERRQENQGGLDPETPGRGHSEEEGVDGQQCRGQNVTDNEDQGDCGVSLGPGQGTAASHPGGSSIGGRGQWCVVGL